MEKEPRHGEGRIFIKLHNVVYLSKSLGTERVGIKTRRGR